MSTDLLETRRGFK